MTINDEQAIRDLSETYLSLLKHSQSNPSVAYDAPLAILRSALSERYGADAEYIQNSFELVAHMLRGRP